jgi:hypothetical protein
MLPFFFRHYDQFIDRYFVFDNGSTDNSISMLEEHGSVEIAHFDVHGDSFVEEEVRLGDTIWRGSDADWVIITDIDEHIYHPTLAPYLQRCQRQGVTAIQSIGYEMISRSFPKGDRPLVELVTNGVRSLGHDRLCIFDPKALTETNYEPGRHAADPRGRVVWPAYPEVLLLHYKQLGVKYPIVRSAELRRGLKAGDIEKGWGLHYTWSAAHIRRNWRTLNSDAGPVPGLGTLKHIAPSKYCEEERVVRLSGLLDEKWYLEHYPDVESVNADPLIHFCIHGWREGRKPNFHFDPQWYSDMHRRSQVARRHPLFHFIIKGEKENAWPSPHFNTAWYRAEHRLSQSDSPLRHYLQRCKTGQVSPNPEFDAAEYCRKHPEILSLGKDPFEAYCSEQE